jgi:hypothetical protein
VVGDGMISSILPNLVLCKSYACYVPSSCHARWANGSSFRARVGTVATCTATRVLQPGLARLREIGCSLWIECKTPPCTPSSPDERFLWDCRECEWDPIVCLRLVLSRGVLHVIYLLS